MDRDTGWQFIENARKRSGSGEAILPELRTSLDTLSDDELYAWWHWLDERVGEAYQWRLWAAAYVMQGGCSDDMFESFRYWLVTLGQSVFERAVSDADSLADLPHIDEDEMECELLSAVVPEILEDRGVDDPYEEYSKRYPREIDAPPEPSGEPFNEDMPGEFVPRLAEKYDY